MKKKAILKIASWGSRKKILFSRLNLEVKEKKTDSQDRILRFRKKNPILKIESWDLGKKTRFSRSNLENQKFFFHLPYISMRNKNQLTMTETTAQRMEEMTCLSSVAAVPSLSNWNSNQRHKFAVPSKIVKIWWKWFSSKFEEFKSSSDLKCWELVIYVGCNEMNSERSKIKNNTLYHRTLCTVKS